MPIQSCPRAQLYLRRPNSGSGDDADCHGTNVAAAAAAAVAAAAANFEYCPLLFVPPQTEPAPPPPAG